MFVWAKLSYFLLPSICWHFSGVIFIVTREVSLELSSFQAAQAAVWPSVIFAHTLLLLEIAAQDQVLRTQNTVHRKLQREGVMQE